MAPLSDGYAVQLGEHFDLRWTPTYSHKRMGWCGRSYDGEYKFVSDATLREDHLGKTRGFAPNFILHGTITGRYTSEEGVTMGFNRADALDELAQERIEQALKLKEQAAEERAVVERFGDDDWEDGAVLAFEHQFNRSGLAYNYLAYKIKGMWYVSGRIGSKLSWSQLVEFMKDSEVVHSVTGWKKEY